MEAKKLEIIWAKCLADAFCAQDEAEKEMAKEEGKGNEMLLDYLPHPP